MKMAAMKLAAVAAGGAIGASLRYFAAAVTHAVLGEGFPYGTLMVNVLGSLLIGYLLVLLPESDEQLPMMRLLLVTGILGGFTTYSAFSIETLQLLQDGHLSRAGMNIVLTLLFCFLAVWGGFLLGKGLHARV
jgi:CrcB protein